MLLNGRNMKIGNCIHFILPLCKEWVWEGEMNFMGGGEELFCVMGGVDSWVFCVSGNFILALRPSWSRKA